MDKKLSTDNNKSRKIPHIRRSRDELNDNNLQANYSDAADFTSMTDNNDNFTHLSATSKKTRCELFIKRAFFLESNTRSNSSMSNDDNTHRHSGDRHGFTSSKSSTDSDTSDDDNLMTKIFVKINQPKAQAPSDDDDEMKISSAMRLVDLNMGNFAPNSRALPSVNYTKSLIQQIHLSFSIL